MTDFFWKQFNDNTADNPGREEAYKKGKGAVFTAEIKGWKPGMVGLEMEYAYLGEWVLGVLAKPDAKKTGTMGAWCEYATPLDIVKMRAKCSSK